MPSIDWWPAVSGSAPAADSVTARSGMGSDQMLA